MSIFDRIILVISSICLAFISIVFIIFPFHQPDILSLNQANAILYSAKGNFWYTGVGVLLLLASIRFIVISVRRDGERRSRNAYIVQRTDHGEINISSETIVGLAQSVADKFMGVRNIKTNVKIFEDQLYIDLKGEVSPEINIPEVTEELQDKVKEHVESCTGINVNEIRVVITNVTAPIRNIK